MSTVSILVGAWLLLSFFATAVLAAIAARGHARRDDKHRPAADATR